MMEETETTLELEVQIKFSIAKEEKMTRHYPGCPAHIDDMYFTIEGEEISMELWNKICVKYGDELDEACWDHMQENEQERAIMQAEYRRDAMEET